MKIKPYALVAVALFLPLACGAQSDEDLDASTDTSFDGLVQVKRTGYRNVWVKPDVDISVYSKIIPGPSQFHYRVVRDAPRTSLARSSTNEFPIEENSRASLEELMEGAFDEELSESKYFTLVEEPGRDVLFIWGGLHDIVSHVPPDYGGFSDIYLRQVGEATLVLQIEDSMTREVLARIVDRRAAQSPGGGDITFAMPSNAATNRADVRRLAQTWARLLTRGLDKWHESGAEVN